MEMYVCAMKCMCVHGNVYVCKEIYVSARKCICLQGNVYVCKQMYVWQGNVYVCKEMYVCNEMYLECRGRAFSELYSVRRLKHVCNVILANYYQCMNTC